MPEIASLARDHPRIESVFGPLTDDEDATLRSFFAEVDRELQGLAEDVRGGTKGLEVIWSRLGQVQVFGDVAARGVSFDVGLYPTWCFGNRSGEPGWGIEASIDADCQHSVDHESMDTVWDRGDVEMSTPEAAVRELVEAARQLHRLACEHPLEYWQALAKD